MTWGWTVTKLDGIFLYLCTYLQSKVNANGGPVMLRKELVDISLDDARFSTAKLSDNQDLEDVLGSVRHVCTHVLCWRVCNVLMSPLPGNDQG